MVGTPGKPENAPVEHLERASLVGQPRLAERPTVEPPTDRDEDGLPLASLVVEVDLHQTPLPVTVRDESRLDLQDLLMEFPVCP
ncbi:hypothetical protein [Ktedonobacter robiniae]|uniref:hypothetical protein n=1 Tax=Ktedonobacter robiniae TaxID=2778365 RepID=UPI001915DF61|nr:hypothetical protein [Ktedonobacter robiniae]